ncbi:hypothetical protein AB1Y20_019804 [Prymnesium parvum]|uniref:Uncharacterized protein n=1 Tax=Prymnesium parvum TaxID=97485 RepID=A0AB34JVP1_PRYPA
MAEGAGGGAATFSFDDLTEAASHAAQLIRARLSPSGTKNTWLGPSSVLSDAIAGSVLMCESSEDGSFVAIVPPKAPSSSPVRRIRGAVSIRVSRDGSLSASRYEELSSLHIIVQSIVPAILTMGAHKGLMADTLRLLESGEPATLSVDAPQPPETSPVFTVQSGQEFVIESSPDFMSIMHELSVHAVPWESFTQGAGWGLPPLALPPVCRPIAWTHDSDALGIATVFGLPSVSSNVEALQFLFGCCEPSLPLFSADELTHGFAEDALPEVRSAVEALLSQLSAATPSSPEIVDSVHSRFRAIRQSPEAPDPFVAFGRAWRQGAHASAGGGEPRKPGAVAYRTTRRRSECHCGNALRSLRFHRVGVQ